MIIEITAFLMLVAIVAGLAIFAGLKTRLTRTVVVRYVSGQLPDVWGGAADHDRHGPAKGPDLVQAQILDPMFWRDSGPMPGGIRPDPMGQHYG